MEKVAVVAGWHLLPTAADQQIGIFWKLHGSCRLFLSGSRRALDCRLLFDTARSISQSQITANKNSIFRSKACPLAKFGNIIIGTGKLNDHGQEIIRLISARKADKNERQRYFKARSE